MKNSKLVTRIISIILLLAMCMTLILPIFAHADARDDYNKAQEEINKLDKELNSISNVKKKQQAEKKHAQTQIGLVKQQIAALSAEISETNDRLTIKQQELDVKKLDLFKTDELFKERLKAMYVKRNSGSVTTILAVNSYSDFLTASVNLTKVAEADTDLLKKLDAEKKAIEAAEAEIKIELDTLETNKADQEKKQNELAGLLQKINTNLSETQAKEEATEGEREKYFEERRLAAAEIQREYELNGGVGDFVGGDWKWPVPSSRNVSSGFGWRTLRGSPDNHTGIDIAAGYGQAIVASNSGTVTVASYGSTGYGNRIMIDHGGDKKTLYAHCSSLEVVAGQYVAQGQVIGRIGSTGNSTGNHLHFEIRIGGQVVDPYPYIQNN